MKFFSKPYRDYIKTQLCTWRVLGYTDCEGVLDSQHDPALGDAMNPGDDLDCIPMCRKHHNLHKDKPKYYRSVITEEVLEVQKDRMIRGFLRSLGLETEKPKIKVPKRKQQESVERPSKWQPLAPNSKRRKTSKLTPIKK
jgi:hypothetical protein